MTALSFLLLSRNAGQDLERCARAIAACTRKGDEVVIVDDGSQDDTIPRIGRQTEVEGWGEGTETRHIILGPDPSAGHRRGYDLAATIAASAAIGRYVLFLTPHVMPDPAGVAAARTLAAQGKADLVLGWPAHRSGPGPDILHPAPSLFGALIRREVLFACSRSGGPAPDTLSLIWRSLRPGRCIAQIAGPLVQGPLPLPDAGPALLSAAADLILAETGGSEMGGSEMGGTEMGGAERTAAIRWVLRHLPTLIAGHLPGSLAGMAEPARRLWQLCATEARLQEMLSDDPTARLLQALQTPQTADAQKILLDSRRSGPLASPARTGAAPLRVAQIGPHAIRMPLSYPALASLWQDRVVLTPLAEADVVVFAHPRDVAELGAEVARGLRARARPIGLFSEEPFWDSLFSPDPLAPVLRLPAGPAGELRLVQINHHTSEVFDFTDIPYYLLTNHRFAASYGARFRRNALIAPDAWRDWFGARPVRAAFMAERRPEAFHDVSFPQGDIHGLCAWRTRLAEAFDTGRVERIGASWNSGPSRFALQDWHMDKMARMDGRAQFLSGIENTHQPTYLTEKLFDAFACGSRPLYVASPGHRVHGLGLPTGSWVNLWGKDPRSAASAMDEIVWDAAFFADYAAAQTRLATLFGDPRRVVRERARLRLTVLEALAQLEASPRHQI